MTATDRTTRSELIQPGQSFGKFYLVQTIGEGGTSRIFKALQQPINRLVALKIPSFTESGSILTPDEFLSEATLMARLEHPNVVRIYDFGVSEDRAFICMEYVEGWNLQELGRSHGAMPLPAALAMGMQTLDALLHSHSQGVLHLDLSPANVLVSKSGTVKLLDFGMAGKKIPHAQGKVIGTPAFLSPEHVQGKPGTPQSDLFSFGSLLYFAALGEPLFDPGDDHGNIGPMLKAIESAREHPPEERIRRLPQALARTVLAALTGTDPEKTARELKTSWDKVAAGSSPAAVLRRELNLDDASPASAEDAVQTDVELRDRYFGLRESGRHREAVALLEKALRRQPDNPLLAELLAAPPAKAKSIPATMAVAGPLADKAAASADPAADKAAVSPVNPAKSKAPLIAALGILAVTLGLFAWNGTRVQSSERRPTAPEAGALDDAKLPAATVAVSVPAPAPVPVPAAMAIGAPAVVQAAASVAAQAAGHKEESPPKRRAVMGPRPPALAISGPAGTRVSLNDSVEWVSPNPEGGWILQPGLVSLTLTLPGRARPINSSLFVSQDSLYLVRLDEDGGFSVSRGPR
jgi:serine/threonine protein kinase